VTNANKDHKTSQKKHKTSSSAMAEKRAKLDIFSIKVQRYSQNHKIAFLGNSIGALGAI